MEKENQIKLLRKCVALLISVAEKFDNSERETVSSGDFRPYFLGFCDGILSAGDIVNGTLNLETLEKQLDEKRKEERMK